ncbi:MAG: DUF3099 domain-containing protein [Cellulomonas sp.]|uniref:DUF3099 domain-containing protein n=1 Tax=Cellulomonas sp. 73-92 TaxID=1895740 RepID=UPI000929788F|nr:DUF3099 domain-containing protein [Cellulomonas sp. 73-92]MBN9374663.1 DUF3099 domain-containing protein [Cellulomonas sp.]OJV80402.1 MAG: hypothetical protein BGO37_03310 [Cellulomonas sp. 73-92]
MGIGRRTRRGKPQVQAITSAPASLADDQARRQRRYLIQMGARVVCFIGAILAWPHVPMIVGILLVAAAAVLPYIAVLGANAGRERQEYDPEPLTRELPPAPSHDALGPSGGPR